MKNLNVRLTPEERDILHSALLDRRIFIESQMDVEARHSNFIEFYFYRLQLVEIKAQALLTLNVDVFMILTVYHHV